MSAARCFLRWNRDQRASPELLGLLIGAGYVGRNVLWAVKRWREEEAIRWLCARFFSCCLAGLKQHSVSVLEAFGELAVHMM